MTAAEFRAARKRLGLTQTAMGEILGIKLRQVQYIEAGEAPIKTAYARLIEAYLALPQPPRKGNSAR